jgi:hypothetical protein
MESSGTDLTSEPIIPHASPEELTLLTLLRNLPQLVLRCMHYQCVLYDFGVISQTETRLIASKENIRKDEKEMSDRSTAEEVVSYHRTHNRASIIHFFFDFRWNMRCHFSVLKGHDNPRAALFDNCERQELAEGAVFRGLAATAGRKTGLTAAPMDARRANTVGRASDRPIIRAISADHSRPHIPHSMAQSADSGLPELASTEWEWARAQHSMNGARSEQC